MMLVGPAITVGRGVSGYPCETRLYHEDGELTATTSAASTIDLTAS
jgi:hypothetical protein|tara:strand:+ start:432 stop:569 length:138 start_codon:yes stop_codon:yes gene_type:complete